MNIYINENLKSVEDNISAYAVRDIYNKQSDVFVLNGFPIKEDIILKAGDRVTLIQKGVIPNYDELESLMIARHTPNIHGKLKKGSIAVLGLGGLGSNIAISLARIGVGNLVLVDYDVVEPSNLNRQQYYIDDIGKYKTQALSENINRINPFIDVKTLNMVVNKDTLGHHSCNSFLSEDGVDIVIEAFDDPKYKAELCNYVLKNIKEKYLIASSGMAGYSDSNTIMTKKIRDKFYISGDFINEARSGEGLMAPRVAICANHMANLAVQILVDKINK
ncbi:sulfur carrier protein ThiS adenylyltransferase ThiF [Clostridioides mangenotii]|uniref:sulfur carrier protein ThiS adenylyltransferase ThiF n=1 Tax=Metaclostridioides mangenotii TaxID=1540 RepID=UPI00214A4DDD|nr:sulfur carrier protein ThiS adenylyltransferase ThiF [Clostridioides mangenotii]MCR1954014.1 sulfur carrier protein ThiS adenylyltransferase ThiF [Clostridioides mangenotii]